MIRSARFVIMFALGVFAGCRHAPGDFAPTSAPAELVVSNQYSLPMDITVRGAGASHRLGSVNPGMGGRFVIPRDMVGVGRVEIVASPLGGGDGNVARSGSITLVPGALVEFEIRQPLFSSTTIVR